METYGFGSTSAMKQIHQTSCATVACTAGIVPDSNRCNWSCPNMAQGINIASQCYAKIFARWYIPSEANTAPDRRLHCFKLKQYKSFNHFWTIILLRLYFQYEHNAVWELRFELRFEIIEELGVEYVVNFWSIDKQKGVYSFCSYEHFEGTLRPLLEIKTEETVNSDVAAHTTRGQKSLACDSIITSLV